MKSYNEILQEIFSSYPMYHKVGGSAYKEGLENIEELMTILGNPQEKLRCIHVAGTNGKGSVSALLASYFQEHGYKTGLFTSPHLIDFRERIKIDGSMIPVENVLAFFQENEAKFRNLEPSFFEITTALAFSYFANENVDIAIIEVGLGGRLDATNVIHPLLAVITNISLEHTQLLGNTIAKIAFEKAGIIKDNTPVVIGEFHPESFPVFEDIAQKHNAPLFLADANYKAEYRGGTVKITDLDDNLVCECPDSPFRAPYQMKNIVTFLQAAKVADFLLNIQEDAVADAICNVVKNTGILGRWQVLAHKPKMICDVGHNFAGLKYSMQAIKDEGTSDASIKVVFGMVNDKDIDNIVTLLKPEFSYYVCCAHIERAMNPMLLAAKMEAAGLRCCVCGSVSEAIDKAKADAADDDIVFITGSCFVVGEALELLLSTKN